MIWLLMGVVILQKTSLLSQKSAPQVKVLSNHNKLIYSYSNETKF